MHTMWKQLTGAAYLSETREMVWKTQNTATVGLGWSGGRGVKCSRHTLIVGSCVLK